MCNFEKIFGAEGCILLDIWRRRVNVTLGIYTSKKSENYFSNLIFLIFAYLISRL